MLNNAGSWVFSQIDEVISSYFTVTAISYRPFAQSKRSMQMEVVPIYEILRRSDLASNMQTIDQQLKRLGFMALLRPHPTQDSRGMLYVLPISKKMMESSQNYTTPLLLFIFTVLSVFFVGIMSWDVLRGVQPNLNPIITGILYVIGLMGIVGIHELGHMFASKLHGIKASWPYFLPFPFGYGTLGAFISQKTPIKSKNDLFDVGLAGPIFGFVIAIFFTIIGLFLSIVVQASEVPEQLMGALFPIDFKLFSPIRMRILLFELLASVIIPTSGSDVQVFIHPLAYAGYIGLLLTGLNLIPIGQLDGGHVARALFSEKNHRTITYLSAGIMVLLNFWFFALLILFMYSQTGHPGPLDDLSPVSKGRKVIAFLCIPLALLCLPIPVELFSLLFPMLG